MIFGVFRKFIVLYFLSVLVALAQSADNVPYIELGQTDFPIERPFTISVVIPNSETRPAIAFPDITGFTKKGITTSVTPVEIGDKTVISQVITQTYQATAAGQFLLPDFSLVINGETVTSEEEILTVRSSSAISSLPANNEAAPTITPSGAAFLALHASKGAIYTGESLALTLSFFVADNYPYVLNFTALDKQLQSILKKIRPVNSWEENLTINELKPIPVVIGGKKFREYRLYQSIFFPLSNQPITLPAVSLQLTRNRPVIGPPSAQDDKITFTSKPITIRLKPLPAHPLRGRVPVGLFRLEERLDRQQVRVGQSVRYIFTVAGEGNIATLPAPSVVNERSDIDLFPPEERHTLRHIGNQVLGRKSFTYFIVPHQNGLIPMASHFQWIYFNTSRARYDTLRPRQQLRVGGASVVAGKPIGVSEETLDNLSGKAGSSVSKDKSIYAGIASMDSTHQPINIVTLIRATANVLIVAMLLGMLFVFFKK